MLCTGAQTIQYFVPTLVANRTSRWIFVYRWLTPFRSGLQRVQRAMSVSVLDSLEEFPDHFPRPYHPALRMRFRLHPRLLLRGGLHAEEGDADRHRCVVRNSLLHSHSGMSVFSSSASLPSL